MDLRQALLASPAEERAAPAQAAAADRVDEALGLAVIAGRFADDLTLIIDHLAAEVLCLPLTEEVSVRDTATIAVTSAFTRLPSTPSCPRSSAPSVGFFATPPRTDQRQLARLAKALTGRKYLVEDLTTSAGERVAHQSGKLLAPLDSLGTTAVRDS